MKIANVIVLLLVISQAAFNIAYSNEIPREQDYQITQAYDLEGRIIKYGYDSLGRKTSTLFPDGNKETIQYIESGGYMLTKTDQNGQFVSRDEYDQQGLLVKITDNQGIEAVYTPLSANVQIPDQPLIAEALDDVVELPTIIAEAPYLYPTFTSWEDFVNQTYYISDSSNVVIQVNAAGALLQWINRAGKWFQRTPKPGKTVVVSQVMKSYTQKNFRHNLMVLTGKSPPSSAHAHHVFPKEYAGRFGKIGIDVHDPRFGSWWKGSEHQYAHVRDGYNARWLELFERHKPNLPPQQAVFDLGRRLAAQYNFNVHY